MMIDPLTAHGSRLTAHPRPRMSSEWTAARLFLYSYRIKRRRLGRSRSPPYPVPD